MDILLIVETKLDDSNKPGPVINSLELTVSLMAVVCYSTLIAIYQLNSLNLILRDVEKIDIEINLWKRKWFICGTYNPQGSNIGHQGSIIVHHLGQLGKLIDSNISKYEKYYPTR